MNLKETTLLSYVKQMFDAMEKGTITDIPTTNFRLAKDFKGTGIFLEQTYEDGIYQDSYKLTNPLKWVSKLASSFGNSLAGFPTIKELGEINIAEGDYEFYSDERELLEETLLKFSEEPLKTLSESQVEMYRIATENEEDFVVLGSDFKAIANGQKVEVKFVVFCEKQRPVVEMDEEYEEHYAEYREDEEDDELNDPFGYATLDDDLDNDTGKIKVLGGFSSEGKSNLDPTMIHNIAKSLSNLVEEKQKAYGDSVGKSERILEILTEDYDNGDGTLTIPKSLVPHLLYQVRIIDKQNRIFSNPDGDLMDESPYADIFGYALLMLAKLENEKQ